MQFNSGEKKAVAIIAIVAVVFTGVVGGIVSALVIGNHHDDRGYLHVAIDDELVTVRPTEWCDVLMQNCTADQNQALRGQRAPLPIGQSATLSVSEDISDHPWLLYLLYADRNGVIINPDPTPEYKSSGSTFTVELPSRPDRVLVNIEVQPLSAVVVDGQYQVARGVLALNTTPNGFRVKQPSPQNPTPPTERVQEPSATG